MTLDQRTAWKASQKLGLMRNGNIVVLVSLAAILVNAILALLIALSNPISLYRGGGFLLFSILMLMGGIAGIVGVIVYLVGLYGLGDVRPEYQKAFVCEIILLVLGLATNLLGTESLLSQIVEAIRTLGALVVLWLVLQGTRYLLESLNREDVLKQGSFVWKINLLSTVVGVLWTFIPTGEELGATQIAFLAIGVLIVVISLAAMIFYIKYLGLAAKALEQVRDPMEAPL